MTTSATAPVTVTPEAAARVQELGMQREFEQMLEHIRQTVPDLLRIEVELQYLVDEPETPPAVMMYAYRPYNPDDLGLHITREWDDWRTDCFGPEVRIYFSMALCEEAAHAG
jgi:hypothetical protein